MLKKLLALGVTAGLLSCTLCLSVYAEGKQQLSVANIKAVPGEEITVKVNLDDNPGIWGLDAVVAYDTSVLTLTAAANGGIFDDSAFTIGPLDNPTYKLSFENADLDNVNGSGVLATLRFTVNSAAKAGTYPITITYNDGDIINIDEELVDFEIVNGSVTIAGNETPAYDVDNDDNITYNDFKATVDTIAGKTTAGNDMSGADSDNDTVISMYDLNAFINLIRQIITSMMGK